MKMISMNMMKTKMFSWTSILRHCGGDRRMITQVGQIFLEVSLTGKTFDDEMSDIVFRLLLVWFL